MQAEAGGGQPKEEVQKLQGGWTHEYTAASDSSASRTSPETRRLWKMLVPRRVAKQVEALQRVHSCMLVPPCSAMQLTTAQLTALQGVAFRFCDGQELGQGNPQCLIFDGGMTSSPPRAP